MSESDRQKRIDHATNDVATVLNSLGERWDQMECIQDIVSALIYAHWKEYEREGVLIEFSGVVFNILSALRESEAQYEH